MPNGTFPFEPREPAEEKADSQRDAPDWQTLLEDSIITAEDVRPSRKVLWKSAWIGFALKAFFLAVIYRHAPDSFAELFDASIMHVTLCAIIAFCYIVALIFSERIPAAIAFKFTGVMVLGLLIGASAALLIGMFVGFLAR